MQFGGSLGILWFLLLLLVAVLIVFLVILIGAALVAAISLPLLLALPTVRRQFAGLTERLTDREVDSLTDGRFVAVYAFAVLSYGVAVLLLGAALGEAIGAIRPLVPLGDTTFLATGTVVGFGAGGLLLLAVRFLTGARRRTLAEWVVFLCSIAVLTGVAAFVVPYVSFIFLPSLF